MYKLLIASIAASAIHMLTLYFMFIDPTWTFYITLMLSLICLASTIITVKKGYHMPFNYIYLGFAIALSIIDVVNSTLIISDPTRETLYNLYNNQWSAIVILAVTTCIIMVIYKLNEAYHAPLDINIYNFIEIIAMSICAIAPFTPIILFNLDQLGKLILAGSMLLAFDIYLCIINRKIVRANTDNQTRRHVQLAPQYQGLQPGNFQPFSGQSYKLNDQQPQSTSI